MNSGELIRKRRQEIGMSLEELGARLGISAAAVSRYELGQRKISTEKLLRIASILEVPVTNLLGSMEQLTQEMDQNLKNAHSEVEAMKGASSQWERMEHWANACELYEEFREQAQQRNLIYEKEESDRHRRFIELLSILNLQGLDTLLSYADFLAKQDMYKKQTLTLPSLIPQGSEANQQ